MYGENLHITPDPRKGIPEPEIPADASWNKMAELLDKEMPVSPPEPASTAKPPSSGGGGILGGISHFWSISFLVLSVAGIVTWGVLRLTNKPETSTKSNDTINAVQNNTITNSPSSINQNNSSRVDSIKTPETIDSHKTKMDLPLNMSVRNNTIQARAVSEPSNKTKNEQHPALTLSPVSERAADNPTTKIPSQPLNDVKTTSINIILNQQPINEYISQDTIKNA
jgi:hypothetical protein